MNDEKCFAIEGGCSLFRSPSAHSSIFGYEISADWIKRKTWLSKGLLKCMTHR